MLKVSRIELENVLKKFTGDNKSTFDGTLEVDDKRLTLIVRSNSGAVFTEFLDGDYNKPNNFIRRFKLSRLLKILSSLKKSDVIGIDSTTDKNLILIGGKNFNTEITLDSGEEKRQLINIDLENIHNSIKIDTLDFIVGLEHTKKTIANETDRLPVITNLCFKPDEEYISMQSLDGFRYHKYEVDGMAENNNEILIPKAVVPEILKVVKTTKTQQKKNLIPYVKITVDKKGNGVVQVGRTIITFNTHIEEYLDVNRIYPTVLTSSFSLNSNDLLDNIKLLKELGKTDSKLSLVVIDITKNGVELLAKSDGSKTKVELDCNFNYEQDLRIGFNPDFFIDSLSQIKNQECYLHFSDRISPVIVRSGKYEDVLFPVRLSNPEEW